MFELIDSELHDLRSKISSTNVSAMNRNPTKVFTGDAWLADFWVVIKIAPLSKRSLPPTPLVGAVCEIIKYDD